jgi:hypothetical protein
MSEIRVNKVINEAGTGAVELTQGATLPSGKTISGAGSLNLTGVSTFSGNVTIGGTLTYEDVTNIDSVGVITARSGINVTGGNTTIKGAVETVNTGAYAGTELTCDTATGTVFTHDLQAGLVNSIKISNFPATANSFHTVTVILTQNDAGTAHTTAATGIGTNITLDPDGVTGFSTVAMVGSGTTVTLGTTANDVNIVTFGVHYNGGTNTDADNYKTFVTKNGDFRLG